MQLGNEAISETEAAIIEALKNRERRKLSETYKSKSEIVDTSNKVESDVMELEENVEGKSRKNSSDPER